MNDCTPESGACSQEKEFGPQPLDAIMTRLGVSNHDLVKVSPDQLTHKMVRKGRTGRRLTAHAQGKILSALRIAKPDLKMTFRDLFNYEGR